MFTNSRCCRYWSRCRRNTHRFLAVVPGPQKARKNTQTTATQCEMGWAQLPQQPEPRCTPAMGTTLVSDSAGQAAACSRGRCLLENGVGVKLGNERGFWAAGVTRSPLDAVQSWLINYVRSVCRSKIFTYGNCRLSLAWQSVTSVTGPKVMELFFFSLGVKAFWLGQRISWSATQLYVKE